MAEQPIPPMTGWRKRQLQARERMKQKARMADIRAERRRIREREEAIARGEDPDAAVPPAINPEQAVAQEGATRRASEHEGNTIPDGYPDPDEMDRDAMFAYLKAHGRKAGPATKDTTLRRYVLEVRDGNAESETATS